jgi:hypothetical protein
MKLTQLKCPHCGAKLKIIEGTIVSACQFCNKASEYTGENVIRLEQSIVMADREPDILLPFWQMHFNAKITNLLVHSPQSLSQPEEDEVMLKGKKTKAEEIDLPERMLIAGFGVNNFVNYTADLSYELSMNQDFVLSEKAVEKKMDYGLCYYGHLDAQGMIEVLLRTIANKRNQNILDIDLDLSWGERKMLWWPFVKDGDCWSDMLCGKRILQSALEK